MSGNRSFSDFSPENRSLAKKFRDWLKAKGRTEGTVDAYRYSLRRVEKKLSVPFEEASKDDMIGVIGELRDELADSTINVIITKVKRFYKWLNDGEYPECVEWMSLNRNACESLPDEILTREDIMEMVEACDHPRDRAMIVTLFESGMRMHEFLALDVRSLEFDGEMGRAILPASDSGYKTGQRRVPLADSVPYLKEWINYHPGGKRDPLWISFANGHKGDRLSRRGLDSFIRKTADNAGLEKNVHAHLFRHSRATEIAGKGVYSEAEMRIMFGWAKGSDMPSKYIHLSGADLNGKFKRQHGFSDGEEEEEDNPLEPVECPECGRRNPSANSFCSVCGQDLEDEVTGEAEEKGDSASIEKLEEALEDPEVKELLIEKIKKNVS